MIIKEQTLLLVESSTSCSDVFPGSLVSYKFWSNSLDVIISIDNEECFILWTIPPFAVTGPFKLITSTPTIHIRYENHQEFFDEI